MAELGIRPQSGRADGLLLNCFVSRCMQQSIALPIPVIRILSPSHNGYPLRRSYLITVNFESDGVVAEIREVSPIIPLRGRGADVKLALESLAHAFDRIVRENHFIPPHATTARERPH